MANAERPGFWMDTDAWTDPGGGTPARPDRFARPVAGRRADPGSCRALPASGPG
ncbi:MAG TPA: hypothetical protein VFQ77_15425 [Pseudonocardiaceae bacterium]|nr:hypothetical protein [Pseudonocardiaceae bacterium]